MVSLSCHLTHYCGKAAMVTVPITTLIGGYDNVTLVGGDGDSVTILKILHHFQREIVRNVTKDLMIMVVPVFTITGRPLQLDKRGFLGHSKVGTELVPVLINPVDEVSPMLRRIGLRRLSMVRNNKYVTIKSRHDKLLYKRFSIDNIKSVIYTCKLMKDIMQRNTSTFCISMLCGVSSMGTISIS